MSSPTLPKLPRIAAADNDWGVALVDLRPITLGMLSATTDPTVAQTFGALCISDGLEFVDAARSVVRTGTLPVAFSAEGPVADGVLFSPTEMEDKWALFLHQGMLIGVRSWSADLGFVADVVYENGALVARSYGGALFQGEPPERGARLLEFLVRALGLREVLPLPLSVTTRPKGSSFGMVCMSEWGRAAQFATHEPIVYPRSARPLRTISLLHIAAARGDVEAIDRLARDRDALEARDHDGRTPLAWGLTASSEAALEALVARGASVNTADEQGATPLMLAVQQRREDRVRWLLAHGADPRACDGQGFTALHGAAETGDLAMVKALLDAGADPGASAQGHTPRSLAAKRAEAAMIALLA